MLTQEDLMAIAGMLQPIKDRLDSVDKRLDGVDKRLDGMDKRLDGMDKRLDGVDKRLDGMDKRLDGMDKRLDGMDEQLKVLDKKNTDTRSVIETQIEHAIRLLAEGHAQIVEHMVKPAQLEGIHPRLDTLENVVSVHSEQIRELQQKTG